MISLLAASEAGRVEPEEDDVPWSCWWRSWRRAAVEVVLGKRLRRTEVVLDEAGGREPGGSREVDALRGCAEARVGARAFIIVYYCCCEVAGERLVMADDGEAPW